MPPSRGLRNPETRHAREGAAPASPDARHAREGAAPASPEARHAREGAASAVPKPAFPAQARRPQARRSSCLRRCGVRGPNGRHARAGGHPANSASAQDRLDTRLRGYDGIRGSCSQRRNRKGDRSDLSEMKSGGTPATDLVSLENANVRRVRRPALRRACKGIPTRNPGMPPSRGLRNPETRHAREGGHPANSASAQVSGPAVPVQPAPQRRGRADSCSIRPRCPGLEPADFAPKIGPIRIEFLDQSQLP
ncbi:hypothetical protein EDC25_11713 [Pseudofulvimonas gallinarii]|uniref:Uncharacterized protein n=1 Tax=Pseudofulvimonas gallinarii TaxID=634155 RepID=A0A4R3L885_9GAMM|nr:hypothetical protein EDC25_11713 [Pseudofulvimonas gallinarii]